MASAAPLREATRERSKGIPAASGAECVFDFDLAEFPLFRFSNSSRSRRRFEPLVYSDTITARDGSPVRREWTAIPGSAGVGGPSAHLLLFDLLQSFAGQVQTGRGISYGTMRAILTRRGIAHPSCRDYERLRQDLAILRGYEIRCRNAWWDSEAGRYVDRTWRLLPATAEFARGHPRSCAELDAGPELGRIVATRGFFPLGFGREEFYRLRPLEQRLAIYLARKFRYQSLHRRRVEDLARALPIEASRPRDTRACLTRTARGLIASGCSTLSSFRLHYAQGGRWVVEFRSATSRRSQSCEQECSSPSFAEESCFEYQLTQIALATGSARDRAWWLRCLRRLGTGPVDRALGQLREACACQSVRSPGALLTKILKDLAAEAGISLR